MKYCPINEKIMWYATCNEEDHDASDCHHAKIPMMQHKQQVLRNTMTSQICDKIGHVAKHCPKVNTHSRNSTNYNILKSRGTHQLPNTKINYNRFINKTQEQNYKSRNMIFNNKEPNTVNRGRIQCEYCKGIGHDFDNCRKFKSLIMQCNARRNHCNFCKNSDHTTK